MHNRSLIHAALLFVLLITILCPQPASAGTEPPPHPILLKDINSAESEGSSPFNYMAAGPATYFFAKQTDGQTALWKTDGTAGGTTILQTGMQPGENTFAVLNGFLYYPAADAVHGMELWRTDLSTGQTSFFFDHDPGDWSSDPSCLTAFEGRVHYGADWSIVQSTDGTPEGTTDGNESGAKLRSCFMEYKNSLYYSAYQPDYIGDNDQYYLAWFGSGGSGRTTDLAPKKLLGIYKDRLYFIAASADDSIGLWSTGGTLESIQQVREILPSGYVFGYDAAEYNGLLYFTTHDQINGYRLWATDGSEAGTVAVTDLSGSPSTFMIAGVIQPDGSETPGGLLIMDNDALWRFDGAGGDPLLLANLIGFVKENDDENDPGGVIFNNVYYFHAWDAEHGVELWRTDGTSAGTTRLADIWPGQRGSMPFRFSPCGSRLCFTADDGVHGKELWQTDGTPEGTTLVADINTSPSAANPRQFIPAGDLVYFLARDGVTEANLWRTDGTSAGTVALNNDPMVLFEWRKFFHPRWATVGDSLFFMASDPEHGFELWKSDGTQAGTKRVKDIIPGAASSNPERLIAVEDRVFFSIQTPGPGEELWVSDGSEAGTRMVKDQARNLTGLARLGNRAVFSIYSSATSTCDLWITDAPATNAAKLSDDLCIRGGYESDGVAYEDRLYFSAGQNGESYYLWTTDGTPDGTKKIPLSNGNGGFYETTIPSNLAVTNSGLYVVANDNSSVALFRIPPGGEEAQFIKKFSSGNNMRIFLQDMVGFGQQMALQIELYTEETGGYARQFWISDGTPSGTWRLQVGSTVPGHLMPSGKALFFPAIDPNGGMQLWQTDGSSAGTHQIAAYAQNFCPPMESTESSLVFHRGRFILSLDGVETDPPGRNCDLWAYYGDLPEKVHLPVVRR